MCPSVKPAVVVALLTEEPYRCSETDRPGAGPRSKHPIVVQRPDRWKNWVGRVIELARNCSINRRAFHLADSSEDAYCGRSFSSNRV
ncbi:hypothetical protein EVAR_20651_1 [Eumeta japonica]|uniref:Uncharacterized protein n=1 Tax=Eumeta variegata TaxID=151549 RepID=A0A4C1VAQ8_EUMVA|nr:hypothetical protein EVAR_20651_1 [Eumeta japonica]